MLLCFSLGAVVFVTTAFADVVLKSGYDQFKDSIKSTFEGVNKCDSYTMEVATTFKDNGKVLMSHGTIEKYDIVNVKRESKNFVEVANIEKEGWNSYWDKNTNVSYNLREDTYHVSKYEKERSRDEVVQVENPFEDEKVKDAEKIFDAVVGNLKEHVIFNEKGDGSKEFSGTLKDSQIPPLVNAISAFAFKEAVNPMGGGNDEMPIPYLVDNVYVKKVSGNSNVNKDGILENLFGTVVISGKDKSGMEHDLTVEAAIKVYDINSTVVQKPDMKGKKVIEEKLDNSSKKYVTEKYIGDWKNDIVVEENDSLTKVGERTLKITSIDDKYVYGKYSETFKEEFKAYGADKKEFEFKAQIPEGESGGRFEVTDTTEEYKEGSIYFEPSSISFNFDSVRPRGGNSSQNYDSTFKRVFKE